MKTAYVTGATGCVGRNVVNELLQDDWDVVVLHRRSSDLSRLEGCAVRLQEVDLYDAASTCAAISGDADAIFHAAGNTSHWSRERDRQWKDNVLATRNLVEAALAKRVKKFIFTSTGATLPYQGADERLTNKIPNHYIRTKRLAELELYKVMSRGLNAVLLHPIIVLGPYDYNSYGPFFVDIKQGTLKAALPGKIVFSHAVDVARAHVSAFYRGRNFESYTLAGTYTTWLDAFQRIARRVGARPPQKAFSSRTLGIVSHLMSAASMVSNRKPRLTPELVDLLHDANDVSFCERRRAREELGYESRSLDEMIEDCYAWFVREGRIQS